MLFLLAGAFVSCSNDSSDTQDVGAYMNGDGVNSADKAKNVFYMIPSPMEHVIIFKQAGVDYNGQWMNDPNASAKYDTEVRKAVNLGVYGADLSYATLNDQTQETMFFVSAAKKLAESLGVMKAFDEATVQRIEDNLEEKDSMVHIVSDVYWIADAYLKENESAHLSTFIIFGGWIESVYIASSAYLKSPGLNALRDRILEQKYTVDNLCLLVGSNKNEQLIELKKDLESIQAIYNTMQVSSEELKTVQKDNMDVLTGVRKVTASDQQLQTLIKQILVIRQKYTTA